MVTVSEETAVDYELTAKIATEAFALGDVHFSAERIKWLYERSFGRGTTVLDLVRILGDIQGPAPRVAHAPARLGDIRQSVGSPASATALLGIEATITLEEGLAALLGVESAAA